MRIQLFDYDPYFKRISLITWIRLNSNTYISLHDSKLLMEKLIEEGNLDLEIRDCEIDKITQELSEIGAQVRKLDA